MRCQFHASQNKRIRGRSVKNAQHSLTHYQHLPFPGSPLSLVAREHCCLLVLKLSALAIFGFHQQVVYDFQILVAVFQTDNSVSILKAFPPPLPHFHTLHMAANRPCDVQHCLVCFVFFKLPPSSQFMNLVGMKNRIFSWSGLNQNYVNVMISPSPPPPLGEVEHSYLFLTLNFCPTPLGAMILPE